MGPKTQRLRVLAPEGLAPLQIAQAIVGNDLLLKAEPVRYGQRTFQDYKMMLGLDAKFVRAYEAQLKEMIAALREYVETTIKVKLAKADQKPLFTPGELFEMQQIIENYHQAFIAGTVGPETLPPGVVVRLQEAGILPSDLGHTFDPHGAVTAPEAMRVIEDAYRYGHVLSAARTVQERSTAHKISYEQFKSKYAPKIPLGQNEKHALDWLQASAFNEIKGLGNKVADDFSTIAIEADQELRRKYVGVIRDSASENVQRSETWRQLASDLGHKTGDWARDFKRIAATEKQKAMQEGQVAGLIDRYGDPDDVQVVKQPNPGACPSCIKAYVKPDGSLRLFKLSDLIANGSNVGLKQRDWKATVGPVHPWCGCELIHVPEGWGFDEDGDLVPEALLRSDWLEWDLRKAGPYYGKRGGMYRDPQHKVSWKPPKPLKAHGKLTAAEALALERLANAGGKQAGQNMAAAEARVTGPHVLVNVPLNELDTHFDDGHEPSAAEKKRVAEYAALTTAAPPIRVLHNARSHKRGHRKAYVSNGNHRVAAYRAAGRKSIEVMMPVEDFARWQKTRSGLKKAAQYEAPVLPYSATVPEKGVVVRIGDPEMRAEVEKVIAKTPPEVFHRDVGITFITTDIPRVQNPLDDLDFAYWSGNEIRISLMLDPQRIARVLPHEIGHSLNVHLIRQLGSIEKVKAWHRRLYRVSKDEGFVSGYAKREPIENAAEVTMLYLYHRKRLMIRAPRQFAFAHKAYRGIFRGNNDY